MKAYLGSRIAVCRSGGSSKTLRPRRASAHSFRSLALLRPQIQNVNVRPQARVIHQVPPIMIRIRIEHKVVAIPHPVAHVVVIVRRHLEEVPADVEPVAPAAAQPPDVRSPNWPLKPTMLPRMIEMVVRIIASRVVSYPTVILRMNVRRFRMPLLILVSPPLLSRLRLRRLSAPILVTATLFATSLLTPIVALLLLLRRRSPHRLRPALWYVPLTNSLVAHALLLSMLTSLLPLLSTLLLWPAFFLRKDSLSKRHHSKRHHHRNKSRKNPRNPFHTLLQSQI